LKPHGGDVPFLLGAKVPGGPLDNAAFLTTIDAQTITPTGTYLVTIEVKNIRSWVYPSKSELYQLLHKAGELQATHPNVKIVPVFVCRRAHYLTFTMADQLGFYVIQTEAGGQVLDPLWWCPVVRQRGAACPDRPGRCFIA
jgi:hypothetical protein